MRKIYTSIVFLVLSGSVVATPREIVMIRHADKLPLKGTAGPALTAKGVVRSVKFAYYFLNTFGEPDYIIAAGATKRSGKENSIRSLQTVGPLANMLAMKYPEKNYPILHPFASAQYKELAKFLLTDERFDNKLVLVCWSHSKINKIAHHLRVEQDIEPWPRETYDTVYDIQYHQDGDVSQFQVLENQYPINLRGAWSELRDRLFRA